MQEYRFVIVLNTIGVITTKLLADKCITLTRRWTMGTSHRIIGQFQRVTLFVVNIFIHLKIPIPLKLCVDMHLYAFCNQRTNKTSHPTMSSSSLNENVIYAWFSLQFSTFILIHMLAVSQSSFSFARLFYRIFRSASLIIISSVSIFGCMVYVCIRVALRLNRLIKSTFTQAQFDLCAVVKQYI